MYSGRVRLTGLCVALLLGVPLFYYSVSYSTSVELYEGDRIERRPCRQCGGEGRDDELANEPGFPGGRCPFCRGTGSVRVIVPGPNRPTRFWGVVVDRERISDPHFYMPWNIRGLPVATPFLPREARESRAIPEGIQGATVTFTPEDGEPVSIRSGPFGRFSQRLAPGSWRIEVSAPGCPPYAPRRPLVVEPLEGPVWLEHATLAQPVDDSDPMGLSSAEAVATYGIDLVIGVSARKASRGFYHTGVSHP